MLSINVNQLKFVQTEVRGKSVPHFFDVEKDGDCIGVFSVKRNLAVLFLDKWKYFKKVNNNFIEVDIDQIDFFSLIITCAEAVEKFGYYSLYHFFFFPLLEFDKERKISLEGGGSIALRARKGFDITVNGQPVDLKGLKMIKSAVKLTKPLEKAAKLLETELTTSKANKPRLPKALPKPVTVSKPSA
jgi:hypothetical protein